MLRKVIIIIVNVVALALQVTAQDYPYPVSPGNTTTVDTDTPTLTWKPSDNFSSYIVEIYSCNYDEGSSFDVLELDNFIYEDYTSGPLNYEASGLANNVRRPGNFTTVDDGGDKFISYRNNFNNNTENANLLAGEDYEGITYLYNENYVVVEERDDVLTFLKFTYDSQGGVTGINQLSSVSMNNSFITGQNNGWEGLTYNPRNDKLYLAKEYGPTLFFESNLPTGTNFTGTVNLTEPFDINSTNWVPGDISGLFHLSLDLKASATLAGDHILILSEADDIMLEVDMEGNLISYKEFNISGNFGSITNGNFKPEGIAYQYGTIWIASDTEANNRPRFFKFTDPYYKAPEVNNPGLVHSKANVTGSQYQIPASILSNNSEYCWRVIGVTPLGVNIPSEYYSLTSDFLLGCTDISACNYDASANVDNGSCSFVPDCLGICGGTTTTGTTCNDNNAQTVNDKYNSNCDCTGTIIWGCTNSSSCNYNSNATADDGSCLSADCEGICGGTNLPGTSCNDNNPQTTNDTYNSICDCVGMKLGCTDNSACNFDASATTDDGSCLFADCLNVCGGTTIAGSPCNDGDASTINDVYNNSCDCIGMPDEETVCYNIINGNDDVEETLNSGNMNFGSNDVDLADTNSKIVGLRFNNIDVPNGASIISAHIQFTADESFSTLTNLNITVEDSGNASAIIASAYNISSRTYSTQNVQWNNVSPWLQGGNGAAQLSPDLAQLIQQIVDRTDWQANNSMLFKITGTGRRSASAVEGNYDSPELCISYSLPNNCPQSLSLIGTTNNNQIFSAEIEIESSANINNSIVDYFAGDTIKLMPGFNVDGSSDFTAIIQICQ